MERAYVYKWTEKSTGKWYIGSRTAKRAHPDDGYICTSKIVKPLILSNPDNWIREILFVGDPKAAIELESVLLVESNAAHNDQSYNQHNQDMKWTRVGCKDSEEVRRKKSIARMGQKNPSYGKTGKLSPNFGKPRPMKDETREKLRKALRGKPAWNKGKKMPPLSEEQKRSLSLSLKGKPSHLKGKKNIAVSEANKLRTGIKRPAHSEWMTGRTWECKELTCPHCSKIGRGGNMKRYHFENCKEAQNGIAKTN